MVVLVLFSEGSEFLVLGMFLMLLCWGPGSGDTVTNINRGMGVAYRYEQCKEYNKYNPLYVKKCLRQKKNSVLGNLKYLYVCQIISLVVLGASWIYYGLKIIYGGSLLVEVILCACSFILLMFWVGIQWYYRRCYDSSFRYMENSEKIWLPFCFIYQPDTVYRQNRQFCCHYYVGYDEMKKQLELTAKEKGYVRSKSYKNEVVEEFNFFTRLSADTLDIFALIHIEKMNEECWDIFNHIFEYFWKENIAGRYETKQMTFTFLICVDEYSRELRKTRSQMNYGVDSKRGRYRLSALLDYSDHSFLEVAADYRRNGGDKRSKQIRKELLDMLGLSMEFNGRAYPEGSNEEESW